MWQHIMERSVCCVLYDMLPYHQMTYNDVILPSVLIQYKLPDDSRRPKHVGALFCVYFNGNFKPFQV
jgi:hypothetical protein